MPRPLKVFKTHVGFYDMIVAAPSMKAAAEAWGSKPNLFARGLAAVTQDPDAVQAALASPGTVLKRPYGQTGQYKVEPDAIPMPRLTGRQKEAAKKNEAALRRKEAEEQHAQRAAACKAQKEAQAQLADIEREEAALRKRRRSLQKKLHLPTAR